MDDDTPPPSPRTLRPAMLRAAAVAAFTLGVLALLWLGLPLRAGTQGRVESTSGTSVPRDGIPVDGILVEFGTSGEAPRGSLAPLDARDGRARVEGTGVVLGRVEGLRPAWGFFLWAGGRRVRLHRAAADSSETSEPDLVAALELDDRVIDLRLGVRQRLSARWADVKLEKDASFRLENVPPGSYIVALEGDELPRVISVPVDVVADGIQVVTLIATYTVATEIVLTIRDRSGADIALRRGVVTFTERRPGNVVARTGVFRRSIGGASTTFVAPLFRSRYDVLATFGSSASSVVLPRPSARTSFVVPADIEAPRVAVRLVVEPVRREAVIVGRVELDEGEMPYGFTAQAMTPDGVAIEVRLKLSPDGTFRLRVDLDRVSGPQIVIESRRHGASLGPFVLDVGAVDLGVLRFKRPVPKSLPR